MPFFSRTLDLDTQADVANRLGEAADEVPVEEPGTVIDTSVYPMPQELQPHPVHGFGPIPDVEDSSLAEAHVGDPDPDGEQPV